MALERGYETGGVSRDISRDEADGLKEPVAEVFHRGECCSGYGASVTMMSRDGRRQGRVLMLKSVSNDMRLLLMKQAVCVLYTPSFEHFGMIPCEAMALGTPVIAVNSGGPVESIQDQVTGFLCPPTPSAFAAKISETVSLSPQQRHATGLRCRKRVRERFELEAFGAQIDRVLHKCSQT
eukprot:Platyproteum_vivax@DN6145_c0_g1_i1.p2